LKEAALEPTSQEAFNRALKNYLESTTEGRQKRGKRMADFWVFEAKPIKRARVHRKECSNCNDGKGQPGQDKKPGSNATQWYPAATLDDAIAIMGRLKPKDGKLCGTCLRSGQHSVHFQ
jgi:hypothetical protein